MLIPRWPRVNRSALDTKSKPKIPLPYEMNSDRINPLLQLKRFIIYNEVNRDVKSIICSTCSPPSHPQSSDSNYSETFDPDLPARTENDEEISYIWI